MTFMALMTFLEDRLGYHRFPVNVRAKELPQLFDSSATHHDFVVKFAHEIYKTSKCQNLGSTIDRAAVEGVLAQMRADIIDGKKTDIDLYHFIEDICVVVYEFFTQIDDGHGGANRGAR